MESNLQKFATEALERNRRAITDFLPIRTTADYQLDEMRRMRDSIESVPQIQAQNTQEAILAHIKDRQAALGADEQLQVTCFLGPEAISVSNLIMPNPHVVILAGKDANGNDTSFIMNMQTVHMVCKVVKVVPPAARIGFIVAEKQEPKS